SEGASDHIQFCSLEFGPSIVRVLEYSDHSCSGHQLEQQLQTFWGQRNAEMAYAGHVTPWPVETGDQAKLHGISGARENDGYRRSCRFGGHERRNTPSDDYGYWQA